MESPGQGLLNPNLKKIPQNKKFKNICPKPKLHEPLLKHFTRRKYGRVGVFKIQILILVDELDALEKCQFFADEIEPNCLCSCTTLYSVMQSDLAELSSWTALTRQLEIKTASYAKYINSAQICQDYYDKDFSFL